MSDEDIYGSNRHQIPKKTPEEIEREYIEEQARKRLEFELDPVNFWKGPRVR